MITKDERDNLPRLLRSLAGSVDCWCVTDTGSTDGTQDIARSFLEGTGQPYAIGSAPFENFEQARNAALAQALSSGFDFEYLMLADSDMELLVDDLGWRDRLSADAYMLLQFTGSFSYWNTRLVRRSASPRYVGVTHEYLDLKGRTERLQGARFRDHASGSSRPTKLPRDEGLLRAGLEADPGNVRYMFYLARTLKEMRRYDEAIHWFRKRAEAGGWDEEVWNARLEESRCVRLAGRREEYPAAAMRAYSARPSRAEPLTDLAAHLNEEGQRAAAAMVSQRAMAIPHPPDLLFVEGDAYGPGAAKEFYIAANYLRGTEEYERGYQVVESIAHSRQVPGHARELARFNTCFYAGMLAELCPGFSHTTADFSPPPGWSATNPSVFRRGGDLWMMQRAVDYRIRPDGSYETAPGGVIGTRSFLLRLEPDLSRAARAVEVLPPEDLPEPVGRRMFSGLEDLRGWEAGGQVYCTAVACELEADKRRQIVVARVGEDGRMRDWRVVSPPMSHRAVRNEKNWMPLADGNLPSMFLYSSDPCLLIDDQGRLHPGPAAGPADPDLTHYRGGSQLVHVDEGDERRLMLAVVHEVAHVGGRRRYLHRFVLYSVDQDAPGSALRPRVAARSRPFHLARHGAIEFAAGLCWHPDGERLVLSFGVEDGESRVGTVPAREVAAALGLPAAGFRDPWRPGGEREAA